MIHKRLQKLNFFFEFFEKSSLLPFYESINNKTNGGITCNTNSHEIGSYKNKVSVVNFIPPYLDLKLDKQNTPFRAFQVKPRLGYMIDLNAFANIDDYFKVQLGSRKKKTVLAGVKRLESCFDISYKMYFGEIDVLEYEFLFSEFERMITKRFEQRKQEHAGYKRWTLYKKSVYDLILKKRASLFVIYNRKKAIVIDLNYHFENILDSAMSSYDIDYAKFGLGNIALIKQVEWCFDNDYKRVDMRWGEVPYKRVWCNVIEEYKCDVVYNKNIPTDMLLAILVSKFLNLKKLLEGRKILPFKLNWVLRGKEPKAPIANIDSSFTYKLEDLDELPSQENISPIDLNDTDFQFLRYPVYNYIYASLEHAKNLNIYSINTEKNVYVIQGKSKLKKLIL
tara:strand:+ start:226 stop:1407 length:1182 start_codon:yes stop_codon:yes gene_type:complete